MLNDDWTNADYLNINEKSMEYEDYKENISYDKLKEEVDNLPTDQNQEYMITTENNKQKVVSEIIEFEPTLWEKITNKNTSDTFYYLEDTYGIQRKKYVWYIDTKAGERTVTQKENNSEKEDNSENN